MKNLLVLLVSGTLISACNGTGSSLNPSISAAVISSTQCTGLVNNAQCIIQITYDTSGVAGLTLGTSPAESSLPASILTNPSFMNSLNLCKNQVATSNGQTICPVTLTYTTTNSPTNINLAFTLGNQTSNTIQITGY